jgi:hypothetical protein
VVDEELEGTEGEREHRRHPASATFAVACRDLHAVPKMNLL